MILSIDRNSLASYTAEQINNICPDGNKVTANDLSPYMNKALNRYENCFCNCKLSGYKRDGEVFLDHLHTDKYITYLYFLSNTIYVENGNVSIASKIMNLIRIISGMFLSFKCELPEHFIFYHSVGTVIGNAKYGDYLMVSQNCTINTGTTMHKNPIIGRGVYLGAGAQIIGDQEIGNRVSLGVGTCVYNKNVPDDSVAFIENGDTVIRKRKHDKCFIQRYWNIEI